MTVRVLPDSLINQIAAGEVVERPASVVKELVENALDAGADQIVIDVADGGRTLISVIDNGGGMVRDDLACAICRHATSKLPDDDLLNINFMGFRGEALPSIASVSDMTIDTYNSREEHGWQMDCNTGQIRPSDWEEGTRIRVQNLFARTPARLKFLRGDRAEMMSVLEVVKRLAMARPDVGFVLNNKWFFPKNQKLDDRIASVMGDDVVGRMLEIDAVSGSNSEMKISGFVSEATLRRASGVDQYLFVNGRPVKDKVLVGALRAAYMDVMHAREFPLCALYLTLNPRQVDVNVSPAKTEVHFLEPAHVRAFIIKTLRDRLSQTIAKPVLSAEQKLVTSSSGQIFHNHRPAEVNRSNPPQRFDFGLMAGAFKVSSPLRDVVHDELNKENKNPQNQCVESDNTVADDRPLGRVIGQFGNKYILSQAGDKLVVVDQHAGHERITYERVRTHTIKVQPLLTPIVINMRAEDVSAVLSVADEMKASGLHLDAFGDDAIAIFEKPADWDMDWGAMLKSVADEVRAYGHSSGLSERLHLKLANWACHHSVRAGQRLDYAQMDALLRDIENTERAGQCNHGRPVYRVFEMGEIDTWFER
ncbi:MAG: DNA mismatch repair endonuclease MutL [Alphaproteobacteria bacterium]|nr:DNA mismatch repair endonuclease MutL [Alphaproteobacteria bacterium]